MIILDNNVLSSFIRLGLLEQLKLLVAEILITQEIFEEYSNKWKLDLPSWIIIKMSPKSQFSEYP